MAVGDPHQVVAILYGMAHPRLLKGIEEFNRREFWTCHETLEELWLADKGRLNQFYQGIIHVAAGFVHVQKGNYNGATRRIRSGVDKLRAYEPEVESVDVRALNQDAERALAAVQALGPAGMAGFDEALYPRIAYHLIA